MTMRFTKGLPGGGLTSWLLATLAATAVAGCGSAGPHSAGPAPAAGGSPGTLHAGTAASVAPSITAGVKAAARPAAAHFYAVYSAGRYRASWQLLAPAVKRQIPVRAWVSVHEACPSADSSEPRVIKAVTVFGNAAIVTTTISGVPAVRATTEDVFDYADGRWGYSPEDLGIYQHGSVAADVTAAKHARLCGDWKSF